jgi:hypothetical protein
MARAHPKASWAKLKSAYRRGEGSIADLAPKFGIAVATATTRCAREKWVQGRQEVDRRAQEAAVEKDVESLAAMLAKHRRFANRLLELGTRRLDEAEADRRISANLIDTMAAVLTRAARQERLAAGIEPAKPVMAFEAAGGGAVLRVKRKRNPDVPLPEGA